MAHHRMVSGLSEEPGEELYSKLDWDESGEIERIEEIGDLVEQEASPSLPIILFSAASGLAGGVIGLYVSYRMVRLPIELSAGLATLSMLIALGLSGAVLSAMTGARAAPANILFSCGLILVTLIFFGLCTVIGAIGATLLLGL
jgi:hypothetical protein